LEDAGGHDFRRWFAHIERRFRPNHLPNRQKTDADRTDGDKDADRQGRGARHDFCWPRKVENKTQAEHPSQDQLEYRSERAMNQYMNPLPLRSLRESLRSQWNLGLASAQGERLGSVLAF
jgi:hypothetical protein